MLIFYKQQRSHENIISYAQSKKIFKRPLENEILFYLIWHHLFAIIYFLPMISILIHEAYNSKFNHIVSQT